MNRLWAPATCFFVAIVGLTMPHAAFPAKAAPRAQEESGETVEEYLQKLSTIPDVVNRKDPFIQAAAPFNIPREDLADGKDLSLPPLERYAVNQYGIVATLLGDQYPRALLKLPADEKGKVVIVKEKDKLGNKGGVITKIMRDGVMVVQKSRSPLGFIDKQEIMIRVGMADGESKGEAKAPEVQQGMPDPTVPSASTGGQVKNPWQR